MARRYFQITNENYSFFNLINDCPFFISVADIEVRSISIINEEGQQIDFPIIKKYISIRRKTGFSPVIIKLGYNCELKGISKDYPIYLNFKENGENLQRFEIGKTGIFEFTQEQSITGNSQTVKCYGVLIPKDINFFLDLYIE